MATKQAVKGKETKQGGVAINLRDRVEMIATGEMPKEGDVQLKSHYKKGEKIKVHPTLADYLEMHGVAKPVK